MEENRAMTQPTTFVFRPEVFEGPLADTYLRCKGHTFYIADICHGDPPHVRLTCASDPNVVINWAVPQHFIVDSGQARLIENIVADQLSKRDEFIVLRWNWIINRAFVKEIVLRLDGTSRINIGDDGLSILGIAETINLLTAIGQKQLEVKQ